MNCQQSPGTWFSGTSTHVSRSVHGAFGGWSCQEGCDTYGHNRRIGWRICILGPVLQGFLLFVSPLWEFGVLWVKDCSKAANSQWRPLEPIAGAMQQPTAGASTSVSGTRAERENGRDTRSPMCRACSHWSWMLGQSIQGGG